MWNDFLQRLASVNPEFTRDDVSEWSVGDFEALIAVGLIHETARATHVACACPEGHWERVRWSEDGKEAFIPCSVAGTSVNVDLERLRRWRGSPTQLSFLLTQALALSGEVQTLPASRLWFLGRRGVAGRIPYFFFAAIGPDELPSAMKEIRRAYGRVTGVLLLPFSPPDVVETDKLRIIDLGIIAGLQNGRLTADFSLIADQFADDHVGPPRASRAKNARPLMAHRRAIVKAFIKDSSLDGMEALAYSLGVSETALHGMIRGDRKRYSDDKLDSVLKKIGCPHSKWDRAAKPARA